MNYTDINLHKIYIFTYLFLSRQKTTFARLMA